jgi:hypothetical protein
MHYYKYVLRKKKDMNEKVKTFLYFFQISVKMVEF